MGNPEPFNGSAPIKRKHRKRKIRRRHPNIRIPNNKVDQPKTHVINLSNISLTPAELDILEKGLLFIPTPHNKPHNIMPSVKRYQRNLRLDYIFHDTEDSEKHPFKPKSKYTPSSSGNATLEQYLSNTEKELNTTLNHNLKPSTSNLTIEQRAAIQSLKQRMNSIIIKQADKGSTLTVVDREKYIKDGEAHLSDVTSYQKEATNPTPRLAGAITNYITQIHQAGYIDKYEQEFMLPPNPVKTQHIYFPYKVHKNPIAVRPVVAGVQGPTTNISKYLDHFLKTAVPTIPSYIKNSQSVVKIINTTTLPPSEFVYLISIDVKSLYTSIPQEQGINACLKHNDIIGLPTHITRTLLNYVLKNNSFSFNGQIYTQQMGVAMGTPIAPTLANLFMADLEQEFLSTQTVKPFLYKRYIDDILMIWLHPIHEFHTFFNSLNQFHPTIKFEYTISETEVQYLDLTIFFDKDTRRLATKTHIKATNTFQYVHYNSHHPHATKRAIIKGEILRYKRQCSKTVDFLKLKQNLIDHFLHRGYPLKIIKQSLKEANLSLPNQEQTSTQKVYPFIIKYDGRRPNPKKSLTKHLPDLAKDHTTEYMSQARPITAYSNMKNIGQIITKSALDVDIIKQDIIPTNKPLSLPHLIQPCQQRGCKTCPKLHTNNTFKCTTTKHRIYIHSRSTCDSRNLIYVLQCPICNLQYVGQTRSSLKQRMIHHRNKYNDKTYQPRRLLYKHFDQHLGNFYPHIIPLTTADPNHILAIEQEWIDKLGTLHPQGLNDIWL